MGPTHTWSMQMTLKRVYQSTKIENFLTFHALNFFPHAYPTASTVWDSSSEDLVLVLKRPLKYLHRRAIKIVLLKNTSLTNNDHKKIIVLLLKHRLMYNKTCFMHKSSRVSINHYSRNYARKLNVSMPMLDLFILDRLSTIYYLCCTDRIKYNVGLQTSTIYTYPIFPKYNLE